MVKRDAGKAAMAPAAGTGPDWGVLPAKGYFLHLAGFSALDAYLDLPPLPYTSLETGADPGQLARFFEDLRYPGASLADAALDLGNGAEGRTYYFHCIEKDTVSRLDGFFCDWPKGRFYDANGLYPLLRALKREGGAEAGAGLFRRLFLNGGMPPDAPEEDLYGTAGAMAVFFARYYSGGIAGSGIKDRARGVSDRGDFSQPLTGTLMGEGVDFLSAMPPAPPPIPETQRLLLNTLLLSPQSGLGLRFLKLSGVLEKLWPELAGLDRVDHSKEYHPEGNVWEHTLETLRYRKNRDLVLSLGLLLHDSGKPLASSSGNRRFDGHAELGAVLAAKLLSRLEYDRQTIDQTVYLVRNHMLPAALPRLPLTRTGEILESPLFPVLMELYRCDESSSFKGLEGYYKSSAAYQAYLKNRRNPYRSADGKKIGRIIPGMTIITG